MIFEWPSKDGPRSHFRLH